MSQAYWIMGSFWKKHHSRGKGMQTSRSYIWKKNRYWGVHLRHKPLNASSLYVMGRNKRLEFGSGIYKLTTRGKPLGSSQPLNPSVCRLLPLILYESSKSFQEVWDHVYMQKKEWSVIFLLCNNRQWKQEGAAVGTVTRWWARCGLSPWADYMVGPDTAGMEETKGACSLFPDLCHTTVPCAAWDSILDARATLIPNSHSHCLRFST